MSISQLFPEEGPTLNLNFAGSRTLDPRITFSRSSVGTYMDANGLIVTAAADEPRFDHRYVNGEIESLGLLIEEQRTNLFIRGSTLGDVGTQPTGLNYATTPAGQSAVVSSDFDVDGNGKSIKHTRGTDGDNNVGYYSVAGLTTGVPHTFSIYVYIPSSQQSSITYIRFGPDTNHSNLEYGYADTNIVDRWQRVVGKYDPSTQTNGVICRASASGGTYFYTDAWQLEVGAFPTSYIPTEGSTKTRNQDRTLIDGEGFTEWYNPTEGTFFCTVNDPKGTVIFGVGNTFDNVIYVTRGAGSMLSNTAGSALSTSSLIGATGNSKIAFAVKTDNSSICVNGTVTANNTTNDMPIGVVRLVIGASSWSPTAFDNQVDGTISQLTYYPVRLSNSQLISLTR